MKHNYHIRVDKPEPDSERIAQHKDFGALMAQYQAQPRSRAPRRARLRYLQVAVATAAAAAAILIVWLSIPSPQGASTTNYAEAAATHLEALPYVHPPFETVRPQFASYQVPAATGRRIDHVDGSVFVIPAAAFEDATGATVQGEVQIELAVYADLTDMLVRGIPLRYDSTSTRFLMQSAGAVEMRAYQQGNPVALRPGKQVDVMLRTRTSEAFVTAYSRVLRVYHLDTLARNWQYTAHITLGDSDLLGEAPATPAGADERVAYVQSLERKYPVPSAPTPPPTRRDDVMVFEFDIEGTDDEGTLGLPPNALLQAVEGEQIPDAVFEIEWEEQRVEALADGTYLVELRKGDAVQTYRAEAVLVGPDYTDAQAAYRQARREYETALADRNRRVATELRQWEASRTPEMDVLEQAAEPGVQVHRMRFDRLGIWGVHHPKPETAHNINSRLATTEGELPTRTGYLLNREERTIDRIYLDEVTPLTVQIADRQVLCMVLPDGRVAVATPDQIAQLPLSSNAEPLLPLNVSPTPVTDKQQLQSLIEL